VRDAVVPPLLLGVAVGVAAVGLLLISNRVASRVQRVRLRTQAIAGGDFRQQPVPPGPTDEVSDLAHAVNHLAERLGEFERQLQQTERLRVLGQFSGGLAHQLRNAAGGARLAVQLYLTDPDGDREPLEVALRQLARIEANLCQFLTLGKPTTLAKVPLDVGELLSAAVRLHGPQCRHAGIVLTWTPPGPLPLDGDATQVGHLFGNLIGNAIEAAGPGGTVAVSATRADGETVVEVSDTGPGPPPAVADRLFEPFVTGREQGIGLGLAVAKQAADGHGGRIDWRREGGKTVFRVVMPAG
jgi:signal transduction histidine kinase